MGNVKDTQFYVKNLKMKRKKDKKIDLQERGFSRPRFQFSLKVKDDEIKSRQGS